MNCDVSMTIFCISKNIPWFFATEISRKHYFLHSDSYTFHYTIKSNHSGTSASPVNSNYSYTLICYSINYK